MPRIRSKQHILSLIYKRADAKWPDPGVQDQVVYVNAQSHDPKCHHHFTVMTSDENIVAFEPIEIVYIMPLADPRLSSRA